MKTHDASSWNRIFNPVPQRENVCFKAMNTTSLPALSVKAARYVALQREMHDALLRQHPEWMERDGNCSKCDDYDRRFAELLSLSLAFNHRGVR